MDRRRFNKAMLLSGTAAFATSALPALAYEDDEHHSKMGLPAFGQVVLTIAAATLIARWFMIQTANGTYGVNLQPEVPQKPANRMSTRKIPLLGQLMAPTLMEQFAKAQLVGSLYLINRSIILLPLIALSVARLHMWITHKNVVYQPASRVRRLKLQTELTPEQIRAGRLIGRAVLAQDTVLGIIPPSVLDDIEFSPKK